MHPTLSCLPSSCSLVNSYCNEVHFFSGCTQAEPASTQHALHALHAVPSTALCKPVCLQAHAGTWDCRYFARIADERMGPRDQAILVTHQPRWLSDWFWDETACHNLRQLVRGHLHGRARLHLAGQLDHTLCLSVCLTVCLSVCDKAHAHPCQA